MKKKYVYRTYRTKGNPDSVRNRLADMLLSHGYKRTGNENSVEYFRYPAITFSSKRPLTCISGLSLEVTGHNGDVRVKIGANFAKIRFFIILVMVILCAVIPGILGYLQHGIPDIPIVAYLGIPLGIMVHYNVRWRVFRALGRFIVQTGDE